MRAWFVAVAGSVFAHMIAVGWYAARDWPSAAALPTPVTPPIAASAIAEPEPLVVALVDTSRIVSAEPVSEKQVVARVETASEHVVVRAAIGEQHIAHAAHAEPADAVATTPAAAGGRGGLMTMRHPEIALSSRIVEEAIAHRGEGSLPPPLAPPLEPGAAAHANDLRIRKLEVMLANPAYLAMATPSGREGTQLELDSLKRERENLMMRPAGGGRYRSEQATFASEIARDGAVHFVDKPNIQREGLGLRFDVTDLAMRSRGDDPYARTKLHFLDKTREERAAMGVRRRNELLARAGELVLASIERLWASTGDLAARKQGMFELWDDCAETGDAALVAAGVTVRQLVVGAIRARLIGTDAYTAAELALLNAHRRSTARFAPYDEP
jgi:hypothetical protein